MEEETYMVCVAVSELAEPVEGSTTTACVDCGCDCWISQSSRKEMYAKGAMPLCGNCSIRIAKENPTVIKQADSYSPMGSRGQFDEIVQGLKDAAKRFEGTSIPDWLKRDHRNEDAFQVLKETATKAGEVMHKPDEDWGSMVVMESFEGNVYPPLPLSKMLSVGVPKDVIAKQLIPGLAYTAQAKRVIFGI
jgi:transcription elongation factor Elf1